MAMFSLANAAGAAFRAALNIVLGRLHGNYYGSTDPASAGDSTPGMHWVDTSGGAPVLRVRNAADTGWISLGVLDAAGFQLAGTTAFTRSLLDDSNAAAARTTLGLGGLATQNILNENNLATASTVRPPSQTSVKTYIDNGLSNLNPVAVGNAIAAQEVGAVGTYALLNRTTDVAITPGLTLAGANLHWASNYFVSSGDGNTFGIGTNTERGSPTGTWVALGAGVVSTRNYFTLWKRIA